MVGCHLCCRCLLAAGVCPGVRQLASRRCSAGCPLEVTCGPMYTLVQQCLTPRPTAVHAAHCGLACCSHVHVHHRHFLTLGLRSLRSTAREKDIVQPPTHRACVPLLPPSGAGLPAVGPFRSLPQSAKPAAWLPLFLSTCPPFTAMSLLGYVDVAERAGGLSPHFQSL